MRKGSATLELARAVLRAGKTRGNFVGSRSAEGMIKQGAHANGSEARCTDERPTSPFQRAISIIVITHNRREMLQECIKHVLRLWASSEVIVVDDASTDGTEEVIRSRFPNVRYHRFDRNVGPAAARNRGVNLCTRDYAIHLDDDSLVLNADCLVAIEESFRDPHVGLVALPFVNRNISDEVFRMAPASQGTFVSEAFTACAYAVRTALFRELGGFREFFFYMGEEPDLALRFLEAGYCTACVSCTPVEHMQPAGRVSFRSDFYGRQNDILADYLNIPAPEFVWHLARATAHGVLFGMKVGRPLVMIRGLLGGFVSILRLREERRPVRRRVFRVFERLRREGPLPVDEVYAALRS